MKNTKNENVSANVATYQPTVHERIVLSKRAARRADAAPAMKHIPRQRCVGPDHPSPSIGYAMIFDELGVENELGTELLEQLGKVAKINGKVDLRKMNFLLSFVKCLKPRDPVEVGLISQMAVIQIRTMEMARRASTEIDYDRCERHEKRLNQLMRTFILQAEALKRYRSSGEQKIVVQKVTVADGGRAIVGNVKHESPKEQPAVTHDKRAPMHTIEGEVGITLTPQRDGDNDE